VNLAATLGDLDELTDVSLPATRELAPFLRELRPLVRDARPTGVRPAPARAQPRARATT
jgi:phospholipid/cholesterol/gamma-HCH transport system substrate-binding protein